MTEKLVIIPRLVTGKIKAVNLLLFTAACALLTAALFIAADIFLLPAMIMFGLWIWRNFFNNIEYEYTYYDGELCIAKITNKARRKHLAEINMEDVVTIAPKGDRSVYKYETDRSFSVLDYTSGDETAKIYELIHSVDGTICRYEFEPDEEMLNAISMKYPRLIVR